MALQLTAAGTSIVCAIESFSYEEKIDDPETCTFDVPDSVGYSLSQNQNIHITDTVTSIVLYDGFIDSVADVAFPGNLGIRLRTVTCKSNRWRAEKRYWTGDEFDGWTAGDAAAKMHQAVLASEGVLAAYALDHDHDAATFGAGTLSGTAVVGNQLTLASSGADFTKTEALTADFGTGTLTNVVNANNALALTSYKAIKYSGTAGANLDGNNLYAFRKIWAGSAYTLVTGDKILFDQWIDSRSPEIKIGLDFQFSDGTWMHDSSIYTDFQDQEVIPLAPSTDLKGWADDQWYSRTCVVPSAQAGKVIVAIYLDIEGEKGGDYIGYFKNIRITNAAGTVQRTIFGVGATVMNANVRASSNGYFNLKAQVVTVYEGSGVRVSPARSITSVGIVRGSVISWVEQDAMQPSGGASTTYPPQVMIEASYDDGATFLPCTNHAPLPGLIIGMNTSARTITLRQTLAVGGPSPEMAPILDTCSFSVYSAAAATKSDFVDIRGTQALLNSGTLTNATSYADGIKTTGQYRNWDNLDFSSQTLFGLSGAGNPQQGTQTGYFFLRTDNALDCRSQFAFAGQWQNFIAEIDMHVVSATEQYGLCYRTTSWVNANNSFAYVAWIDHNQVALSKGNNGAGGSFVTIQTVPISLTVGAWYRMKVVANGNNHQIYLNDVLFVNVVGDGSYPNAGYFGARLWNGGTTRDSGHYDNFGVVGYESDLISVSSWTTPALALSGIVGDSRLNWNASQPSSSGLIVESTLDNGTTYQTCTNGGQIPLLVAGFNAAGKFLKIRYSMTNQSVNLPIVILGHSVFVTGQYSASGTRISPSLDISPAGTIGSSSMGWLASQPTGTGVAVAGSTDNLTYTPIASSGSPIPGLAAQGVMMADDFDTNSAANYTATFWSGGVAPVFTIDTAHSRMQVTSGTNAILVWTAFGTAQDVYSELITDECDAAGLVVRYIDINNLYYVTYRDNSAGTNPNTVAIRKRVASTDTQLVAPTTLPGTFTRGTYHTLKVTCIGSTITCYFDGVQAAQVGDASLPAAGYVGIRQNSAVTSNWYSLRAQQLGASAAGKLAYSKMTLTSTDPAQKPAVSMLVMSVRGPDLMTGALLSQTSYADKKISDNLKDAAGQSKYTCRIDKNKNLILRDRAYTLAPWPLYSADPLFKGVTAAPTPPTLTSRSPAYRNRQYVTGAISLSSQPESKVGDGSTQSWPLSYPVDSISSLTLDGNPQTWGVQGTDTGKNFYYQPGNNTLSADSTLFPEDGANIAIVYVGQVPYRSMRESAAQQAALALIDGTSGIVEASEDCGGLSAAAADTIAQARIDQYAILSVDWEYPTARGGLVPGQLQSIFVPEHSIVDVDVLITDIKTSVWADSSGNLNYLSVVSTTSGPNVGTWQRIFATSA